LVWQILSLDFSVWFAWWGWHVVVRVLGGDVITHYNARAKNKQVTVREKKKKN
jgi:hypothetical protein